MTTSFHIVEYDKLLALHRALMEAKFTPFPNDQDIAGSSLVAEVANQVVDILIAIEIERGSPEQAKQWNEWRHIDTSRREWKVALERAQEVASWQNWSLEEKTIYSQILLSPFVVTEDVVAIFIQQVDNELKGKTR